MRGNLDDVVARKRIRPREDGDQCLVERFAGIMDRAEPRFPWVGAPRTDMSGSNRQSIRSTQAHQSNGAAPWRAGKGDYGVVKRARRIVRWHSASRLGCRQYEGRAGL